MHTHIHTLYGGYKKKRVEHLYIQFVFEPQQASLLCLPPTATQIRKPENCACLAPGIKKKKKGKKEEVEKERKKRRKSKSHTSKLLLRWGVLVMLPVLFVSTVTKILLHVRSHGLIILSAVLSSSKSNRPRQDEGLFKFLSQCAGPALWSVHQLGATLFVLAVLTISQTN